MLNFLIIKFKAFQGKKRIKKDPQGITTLRVCQP